MQLMYLLEVVAPDITWQAVYLLRFYLQMSEQWLFTVRICFHLLRAGEDRFRK